MAWGEEAFDEQMVGCLPVLEAALWLVRVRPKAIVSGTLVRGNQSFPLVDLQARYEEDSPLTARMVDGRCRSSQTWDQS